MKKRFLVVMDGEAYEVEVEIPEGAAPLEAMLSVFQSGVVRKVEPPPSGRGVVRAPITGRVAELKVHKGATVHRGDPLVLIESMKTIVEVKSDVDGVVEDVMVEQGAAVKQGDPLLRIS
ncbi:MAG: biotin/lipoyl-containing protein [Thermofilum sp.]